MSAENWNVVLIILTVVVAAYAVYMQMKNGKEVNLSTLVATVEEKIPFATELTEVAQTVVNEIEQSVRDGVVISNEDKFNRALNLIKGWDSRFSTIDNRKIISAIKSAVFVASALTNAIKADKIVQAEGERKGLDV